MARKVVCKICKTKGDTDTFYKVTDQKGLNKYYCSKEEYDTYKIEQEKRHDLMEYVAIEVLNYEEGQIVPPVMVRKIGELHKFYAYEVIKECFVKQKDDITYWMNAKNFQNEYNMVCYIMKIIEGNINDTYIKWKHQKKQSTKMEYADSSVDIMNDIEDVKLTQKKKENLLSFLDEGDL